ncbi:hypothetical protein RFI_40303, partial [Reticulomyxa filosa]
NDAKDGQMEQKENQDGKQKIVRQPRCDIYRKKFAAEQKKKREEAETLEDYGYQTQEVKRFHKMPIVKVLLSKTEDIIKILKDNDIQIGYSVVKVEPFDKGKSRPKYHFKQCRKCYRLNYIASECPRKRKLCKYCGLANHEAAKCRHKNNPSKHKCVLCRKQHSSDSLQCDVIRKAREKLGIKLTMKED